MVVQFICRGNAFRSIIAEAYLRSRQVPGVVVRSSGTRAAQDKADNAGNHLKTLAILEAHGTAQFAKKEYGENTSQAALDTSDIVIFMDKIARDEARATLQLPAKTYVWDIADMDPSVTTSEARHAYREKAYRQITGRVDEFLAMLR
jgi:protein-tyrosine-phosphatase